MLGRLTQTYAERCCHEHHLPDLQGHLLVDIAREGVSKIPELLLDQLRFPGRLVTI